MTTVSDDGAQDDQPPDARDQDPGALAPEWAPVEPLPSSEMFLAAFAGLMPVAANDILDPAFELVACQKQYRLAFDVLANESATGKQLKTAAGELVSAQADIDVLITIIDDAVGYRLRQHRNGRGTREVRSPASGPPDNLVIVAIHTESIAEIAARMAELWEVVAAKAAALDELPEAHQLVELCKGYDYLAAEIESGRRIPPGM